MLQSCRLSWVPEVDQRQRFVSHSKYYRITATLHCFYFYCMKKNKVSLFHQTPGSITSNSSHSSLLEHSKCGYTLFFNRHLLDQIKENLHFIVIKEHLRLSALLQGEISRELLSIISWFSHITWVISFFIILRAQTPIFQFPFMNGLSLQSPRQWWSNSGGVLVLSEIIHTFQTRSVVRGESWEFYFVQKK